jgi:uncharacterized protein YndB with AHSA1/START domain
MTTPFHETSMPLRPSAFDRDPYPLIIPVANAVRLAAAPDEIFAVLLSPACYPKWVVGTKEVVAVDPDWPAAGARFHHHVGAVGEIADSSEIVSVDAPHSLQLEVRFRPLGVALVTIDITPLGDGHSRVTLFETPVAGPAQRFDAPLRMLLGVRNTWSLLRLKRLVQSRVNK